MGKCTEKELAYYRMQYRKHREQKLENKKKYQNTPFGRAVNLLSSYNASDNEHNRGKGDLTAEWIVESIFTKPCAHCGKTGWDIIGCNRLDNSKPHTMDNVEPCCGECNKKLHIESLSKRVYQYTLDGELVKVWDSIAECARNGYDTRYIYWCDAGGFFRKSTGKWINIKQYKGYRWSLRPL